MGDIVYENHPTKHTVGEAKALLAPLIGCEPEELQGALVFGITEGEIRIGAPGYGKDELEDILHNLAHYLIALSPCTE